MAAAAPPSWIQDGGYCAAILDLAKPEIAPFNPPTSKTPP